MMRVLMLTSSYPKFRGDTTAPFIESIATHIGVRPIFVLRILRLRHQRIPMKQYDCPARLRI
jgi:hypothetical protein